MREDCGQKIPGSIYYRGYCRLCKEAIRVVKQEFHHHYLETTCDACRCPLIYHRDSSMRAHDSRPFGQIIGMGKTGS